MDLDKPLPEDVQLVLQVAAMLEASEYEIFLLAFQRWAGDEASVERLEPIFVATCSKATCRHGSAASGRMSSMAWSPGVWTRPASPIESRGQATPAAGRATRCWRCW